MERPFSMPESDKYSFEGSSRFLSLICTLLFQVPLESGGICVGVCESRSVPGSRMVAHCGSLWVGGEGLPLFHLPLVPFGCHLSHPRRPTSHPPTPPSSHGLHGIVSVYSRMRSSREPESRADQKCPRGESLCSFLTPDPGHTFGF